MEDFHWIFNAVKQEQKQKIVLATVIHVKGSAYKKEGSSMIFYEDGRKEGTISADCLEEDLTHHAKELFINQNRLVVTYDLREEDDLTWGQGAGCNGVIYILLEPLDRELFQWIDNRLKKQIPVLHIKKLNDSMEPVQSWFVSRDGHFYENNDGEIPRLFEKPFQHLQAYGQLSNISSQFYIHVYWPKPRLIVIGAGQDARPLTRFASQVGFNVVLCDWREALCQKNNFPEVEQFIVGFPNEIMEQLSFHELDSVVLMTHHFNRDQELLTYLLTYDLFYLGILGSKRRTKRLLKSKEKPKELSAPVGLSIGAVGEAEIAISILAEIIQKIRMPEGLNSNEK